MSEKAFYSLWFKSFFQTFWQKYDLKDPDKLIYSFQTVSIIENRFSEPQKQTNQPVAVGNIKYFKKENHKSQLFSSFIRFYVNYWKNIRDSAGSFTQYTNHQATRRLGF